MNIYNATDLLNKGKKVYNTHWNNPKVRYIWLSKGEQQDLILDDDNQEVPATDLLYTEGWEEYTLLTIEEKAILRALIAIDYDDVDYVQFVVNQYKNGDALHTIHLYRNCEEINDFGGIYKIRDKKLFSHLTVYKYYHIHELALDEKE